MFKYLNLLFALMASVVCASCSSDDDPAFGSIAGRVYDYATHEPLAGVQVSLTPNTRTITTDNTGNFTFSSLESGTYTVSASLKGYASATSHVSVYLGETSHAEIALKKETLTNGLQVSTNSLTFDKGINELTFEIKNVGENGPIKWNINLITVDWLTVTPSEGTLGEGMASVLKVIINRKSIPDGKSVSTSFNVSSGDASKAISVLVNNATGGNENPVYGIVKGQVVNSADNTPIYNATISDASKGVVAKSDASGNFTMENLTPGNYNFNVIADGFEQMTKSAYVGGGTTTNIQFSLTPLNIKPIVTASTKEIEFGLNATTKTLTLTNSSSVDAAWQLFETSTYRLPSWLSMSPKSGTISRNGRQDITLTVDRSKLTSDYDVYVLGIEGKFDDISVTVTVERAPQAENYSSASISSCDSRVVAEIVGCHRYGNTVTFDYTLTNKGLGTVNDWRIYPPKSMSLIQGGTRSVVWTSDGTSYDYPTMTFNGKSTSGSNVINTTFPEGPKVSGSVTITGVSTSAKEFNLTLGVYAYPNSYYNMASSAIKFTNVPIY